MNFITKSYLTDNDKLYHDLIKVTYSCILGDRINLLKNFEIVINSGQDCILIIKASQRFFNSLLIASINKETGLTPEQSISIAMPYVFWKTKPIMLMGLNLWSTNKIEKCIDKLLTIEEQSKKFPLLGNTLTIHTLLGISSWINK